MRGQLARAPRVTSARKLFANRANARASTGPRTAACKARVAGNARRHGLSRYSLGDPAFAQQIAVFARLIAGTETDAYLLHLARRIAAAQIDVIRVRRARLELLSRVCEIKAGAQLVTLDRYERYALTRRRLAIREFDDARWAAAARAARLSAGAVEQEQVAKTKPTGEWSRISGACCKWRLMPTKGASYASRDSRHPARLRHCHSPAA
jgi:hypothetical protein